MAANRTPPAAYVKQYRWRYQASGVVEDSPLQFTGLADFWEKFRKTFLKREGLSFLTKKTQQGWLVSDFATIRVWPLPQAMMNLWHAQALKEYEHFKDLQARHMVECSSCGNEVSEDDDDLHRVTEGDEKLALCQSCYDKEYTTCDRCSEVIPRESSFKVEDDIWCESCHDDHSWSCSDCKSRFSNDSASRITASGSEICQSCYEDRYGRCHICEEIYLSDDLETDDGGQDICSGCEEKLEAEKTKRIRENTRTMPENQYIMQWADIQSPWNLLEHALSDAHTVYVWGVPGLGKTYTAQRGGSNRLMFSQTCNQDLSVQEYMGFWAPGKEGVTWLDGPVIRAMKHGGLLVLNELHKASEAAQDFFLAVLDNNESSALTLPSGETVTAAAGFRVVATANDAPSVLTEPLRDRFEVVIKLDTPHPELVARLNQAHKGLGDLVLNSYGQPDRRISPRSGLAFARLLSCGWTDRRAAYAVFGDRAQDILNTLNIGSR